MSEQVEAGAIRRVVAAIFLFGSLGTGVELILLEHTEGLWQKSPLILIPIGWAMLGALGTRPAAAVARAFQVAMVLFIVSGIVGVLLHYQGNLEFERELRPGASGLELYWEAMKGATPALAPGTMVLLGALGLAYTYCHPATRLRQDLSHESTGGLR
jgi:hypothetical protein